jgi:hypothetical protein
MTMSNVKCPDCGSDTTIDKSDPSGLRYTCDNCGKDFTINYGTLYDGLMEPAGDRYSFKNARRVTTKQSNVPVISLNEPSWLWNVPEWIKFKVACQKMGIKDPWNIIGNDGMIDLANLYTATSMNDTLDFIGTIQNALKFPYFKRLSSLIASRSTASTDPRS